MTVCKLHSVCFAGLGVVETSAGAFRPGQRVVSPKWGAGTWQHYISVPEENLVRNSNLFESYDPEKPFRPAHRVLSPNRVGRWLLATVPRGAGGTFSVWFED